MYVAECLVPCTGKLGGITETNLRPFTGRRFIFLLIYF